MKWYISLVAIYGTLAAATPAGTAIDFPTIQGEDLNLAERGLCSNNDNACCCACACNNAWPCVGCSGVSDFSQCERSLTDDDHRPRCARPSVSLTKESVQSGYWMGMEYGVCWNWKGIMYRLSRLS